MLVVRFAWGFELRWFPTHAQRRAREWATRRFRLSGPPATRRFMLKGPPADRRVQPMPDSVPNIQKKLRVWIVAGLI